MNNVRTSIMSVDVNGSDEAEESLRSPARLSSIETEKDTDGIQSKAVNQDFISNLAYFKRLEKSDGSTKTRRQVSGRKRTTAKKDLTQSTTSTTPSVDTERLFTPLSIDSSSTWENELESVRSLFPLRSIDSSSTWEKELESVRRSGSSEEISLECSESTDLMSKRRLFPPRSTDSSSTWEKELESVRRSCSLEEISLECSESTDLMLERRLFPLRSIDSSSTREKELESVRRFHSSRHDDASSKEKERQEPKRREFSPGDMQVFQQPMCLVRTDGKRMIIEDKTVEQINKIPWPMIIVAIVGLYKTGKSYLMNLLAGSNKGFALGDTIQSKTKGIWVWCKVHPEKPNTVLMLLDTEGLGDVEKGDPNHDNKIFTLATLLCNCLVYNMKGAFDQDAVSKLTFITEMSTHIRFRGSRENACLNLVLPDLVLCLRDLSFKFVKDGRNITEDEYLEECLKDKKARDDRFNKPRECIRKYFPVRKCFAFPVPGDDDVIANLEKLPFGALSKRFKETICHFVSYISSLTPKELLASKPITGQMFKTLATRYVTNIDRGDVLDVDDAFCATAQAENDRISKHALKCFEKRLTGVKLPATSRHIEDIYTKAQRKTLIFLREKAVHDKDGLTELKTQEAMDKFWSELKKKNTKEVRDMCDATLENESKKLKDNISENLYKTAGGHIIFKRDLNKLKDKFMSDLRDFEEHEILWTWYGFLKKLERTESEIIEADEHLSHQEKEAERRHYEEQITITNENHKRCQIKALKEQRKLLEVHYEKIQEKREEQFKKEKKTYRAFSKLKLEKDKAERELQELKRQQQKKKETFLDRIKLFFQ